MVQTPSWHHRRNRNQDDLLNGAGRSGNALIGRTRSPAINPFRTGPDDRCFYWPDFCFWLLEAEDVLCTAVALRALGAGVEKTGQDWIVDGVGVGGLTYDDIVIWAIPGPPPDC